MNMNLFGNLSAMQEKKKLFENVTLVSGDLCVSTDAVLYTGQDFSE